jgi:arylsulfatase A-like enzyme
MRILASRRPFVLLGFVLVFASCRPRDDGPAPSLLHLADLLDQAEVVSAGPPESARRERRWDFDGVHPDWRTVSSKDSPSLADVELEGSEGAMRVSLLPPTADQFPFRTGGIAVDLGELRFEDWDTVLVRARSLGRFAGILLAPNLDEEGALPSSREFFTSPEIAPVFNDGSVQTYAIPLRPRRHAAPEAGDGGAAGPGDAGDGSLRSLAVLFGAPNAAGIEVQSVALVPRGSAFLEDAGSRPVTREGTTRHTLFAHAPARLRYPVEVTSPARLDFGLAVSPGDEVTYRVHAEHGGRQRLLFEETVGDPESWHQRSVDLAELAGREAVLTLEAESSRAGAVALWGAPILSTGAAADLPDVIDGGDANLMSLYGYGRPTTPFLEELAAEGVLFTRAHSNATWTQPSTVSFMTSLQHSVLGGLRRGIHSTGVPAAATTMAEHFRRGGYQTASFTANPNAGRVIGLERGVDYLRDLETEHHSTSSVDLHRQFESFREIYPGAPTWVHFQTTDVHEPHQPEAPWAGRFVSTEERARLDEWDEQLWQTAYAKFGTTSVAGFYDAALAATGIDRHDYFDTRRGLYDETMAHQDHALEEFVARLKADGRWEKTLFILGADHGHPAGTFTRFGRGLIEPQPEPWQGALFDAYSTRVPLLVIWPGHIEGGRTVDHPVAMIDVLPTVLDLVGLAQPKILQGQSLAPLLRGEAMDMRPVILDEFRVDEASGEMVGNLEIIDGRWGASLEIAPVADGADPSKGRHAAPAGGRWGAVHPYFEDVPRLLLYDLEADPFALKAVNDEHPDVVRRYHRELLKHWQAHQALATRFQGSDAAAMTPEQLQQLQALGYIQ